MLEYRNTILRFNCPIPFLPSPLSISTCLLPSPFYLVGDSILLTTVLSCRKSGKDKQTLNIPAYWPSMTGEREREKKKKNMYRVVKLGMSLMQTCLGCQELNDECGHSSASAGHPERRYVVH